MNMRPSISKRSIIENKMVSLSQNISRKQIQKIDDDSAQKPDQQYLLIGPNAKLLARGQSKISKFSPAEISMSLPYDQKNVTSQGNLTTAIGSVGSPLNMENTEASDFIPTGINDKKLHSRNGSRKSFNISQKGGKHRHTKTMEIKLDLE